jgi:ubiquitin carboxyl-terminal hydrolase 22/27/51
MASLDSVNLLSEAAFGCGEFRFDLCTNSLCPADPPLEHLAALLSKDEKTAGQFKVEFRKKDTLLAPYSKPEAVAVQTTGLRTVESLKPKFHCLSCSEVCLDIERQAHTAETGHVFCKPMVST